MNARCKSCGAAITWARSERGKPMPLSEQSKQRRFVVGQDGTARMVDTYTSHFADCPNADQHRKERA